MIRFISEGAYNLMCFLFTARSTYGRMTEGGGGGLVSGGGVGFEGQQYI